LSIFTGGYMVSRKHSLEIHTPVSAKKFIKKNLHIIHSNQHKIISRFSGRYFFADYSGTKKTGFSFFRKSPEKKL